MKCLVAVVLLLTVLSLASAIPRKRTPSQRNLLHVAYEALTSGQVPDYSEYSPDVISKTLSVAWKSNGEINERFGNLFAERVSTHPTAPYMFVFKGESSQVAKALEFDLSIPDVQGSTKTIILTPAGEWEQI